MELTLLSLNHRIIIMDYLNIVQTIGSIIDLAGVLIIILGLLGATVYSTVRLLQKKFDHAYTQYRALLGRSILLGLEFLVAGDIIRTIALAPTLVNITILLGIVIIRTFLSIVLQMEVERRWPWQKASN